MSYFLYAFPMYARFQRDGYVVAKSILDADTCSALLDQILEDTRSGSESFVLQSAFRLHTPLRPTSTVRGAVCSIVDAGFPVLDAFLPKERHLAELSSLTVFPGAEAQVVHPDETNEGRFLVTCFANLFASSAECGALHVVPRSHKNPLVGRQASEAIPIEAPAGSVVFMNSKTHHFGGANTTKDRIRPVFYVSFGDQMLSGPTYSILPRLRDRHKLDEFRMGPLTAKHRVLLTATLRRDLKNPLLVYVKTPYDESELDVDKHLMKMLLHLTEQTTPCTVASVAKATKVPLKVVATYLGMLRGLGVIAAAA